MNIITKDFQEARIFRKNISSKENKSLKRAAHKKNRAIFKRHLKRGDDTIRPAYLMTGWDIV